MTHHRRRLLFASVHSYVDPSSGAALATRDLMELMAARGWECSALTAGLLDHEQDTPFGMCWIHSACLMTRPGCSWSGAASAPCTSSR
jgi:hypothetical protein